jgi:hypothetical protein
MDKLHKSMSMYVKSLSKRNEVDDREKALPGGYLGSTMISHGEDFQPDSEFGQCLDCEHSPAVSLPYIMAHADGIA